MKHSADKELRGLIEVEKDVEKKELMLMAYGGMIYCQYVKEMDPELHKKAVSFMQDMHGVKGASFEDPESP